SLRQPDAKHLHPEGRTRGRETSEHGHLHLSGGQPVLEVQPGGVPEAAGLFARFPAMPSLLSRPAMSRARCSTGARRTSPGGPTCIISCLTTQCITMRECRRYG